MSDHHSLRMHSAAAAGAAALFVFMGAALWGFYQRAEITDRICAAQIADRDALRAVVMGAEQLTLTSRVRTEQDERRVRDQYARLLAQAPPLECENGKPVERKEP
jgi:hypothetical protein